VAQIEIKTHRERPIPPRSVRELYEHVSWSRPANEEELREVLEAGPAVGAWDGERLVGFVRTLSDGHLAAYVEDVMVHQDYRRSGVGERIMSRLLRDQAEREREPILRTTSRSVLREERLPSDLLRAHAAERRRRPTRR
jgi:GNAT superfamily N-acetyltransferase